MNIFPIAVSSLRAWDCRTWRHVLAALIVLFAPQCAQADLEKDLRISEMRKVWEQKAKDAAWYGDFDTLEQMYARTPDDAKNPFLRADRIASMYSGLSKTFSHEGSDAYFTQLEALTLANAVAHPQSPLAHLLHIRALTSHGWAIRGTSYASEVSPAAWEGFARQFKQAKEYLAAHKTVVLRDSRGYADMMYMGYTAFHMELDQTWTLAQAAFKLDPYDDYPFEQMLTALLPRWGGGTPDQVEAFIREASRLASPQWGHAMYARLYVLAFAQEYRHGLFENTRANWQELKLGFDDLQERFPSMRNRLRYAYFACMARDLETFRTQTGVLGATDVKTYVADIIGSNSERIWGDCKRWGDGL